MLPNDRGEPRYAGTSHTVLITLAATALRKKKHILPLSLLEPRFSFTSCDKSPKLTGISPKHEVQTPVELQHQIIA